MDNHLNDERFAFGIIALVLMVLFGVLSHWIPELTPLYTTFVGGVTGTAGLYLGANAFGRHLENKGNSEESEPEEPQIGGTAQ
jgi:uncharacterized BrkB/YihY/UPF0761 family membrane protein